MQKVADCLNFPSSVAVDPWGTVFVAETGLPFDGAPLGGVIYEVSGGICKRIVDGLRVPVNGLGWFKDSLIVSEGGSPGSLTRVQTVTGACFTILDGLPGFGNYQTNMAVTGPDGKIYFSQGAMTNSGIIGLDSRDIAWLDEVMHNCDVPGFDITLSSFTVETVDPRSPQNATVETGGFSPFGTSSPGRRISGRVPCTAAIMRCNADGSDLELVAWGLRNAYGLGFLPDGRLLAIDQGADERGSRPIAHCPDFLYEIRQGAWYGWPDFYGGRTYTDAQQFVLANHHELPPPEAALVEFEPHTCATRFAVIPNGFPNSGDLIVTCFGDEKPMTAPGGKQIGRALVRVSTVDWSIHALAISGLKRPIDVVFCPASKAAYVLDFGNFEMTANGVAARSATGSLWKLTAEDLKSC